MLEWIERDRPEQSRLKGMILLSMLFHAVILLLLFFTPSFPSPKLTFGPVYTVSLVNFSGSMIERRGMTAASKELMEGVRSETVLKKRLDPEPIVPIRSLESRKKPDQDLEKAMEEIRKRASASTTTPKTSERAFPEMREGPPSPASSGGGDVNDKMGPYYSAIWSRIKGQWVFPGLQPGDSWETVIHMTILRSGAVTGINFEKRSGNRYFDDSALKAIQKASPFPPLPAGIGGGNLDVGIRFFSSELRS